MSSRIVAILFITLCYTSKSLTYMNNTKNGTLVIGESNKIRPQAESVLRRDDDRVKIVCSNLTELGNNRYDDYIIAKLLAGNNTATICSSAAESNYGISDDNKLTREVRQSNVNYRLKRAKSDNELTTYRKKKLLQKDIAPKFLFGNENKVNMFSPPEVEMKPAQDKEVEQEVNEAEEIVKEQTTAAYETVPEPEEEEQEVKEGQEGEEDDDLEAQGKQIKEEKTTPETSAPDDEEMSSEVKNTPDSEEHEDSKMNTKTAASNDEDMSSLTTGSSENPDEDGSAPDHLSAPGESDSETETDYEYENEDSVDKTELSTVDRKDVDTFIHKLDHILETSGDYIIAVMLNNYKRRMRQNHVNEKFWHKVHEVARKTGGNEDTVKNKLQKKIRSKFGRPFIKEVANSLRRFAKNIRLTDIERRMN